MAHILIVDDEAGIRDTLAMIFEYEQHRVTTAESGLEALKILETSDVVDCILLDVKMPGIDGLETLERLKVTRPEIPVIMISGHGTIETAVDATRRGAFDFLEKPPDRQKLLLLVRNAIEKRHLVTENRVMREKLRGKETMLGRSEGMRNIRAIIERVAPTEARVLITGENGSGKELVARAIHRHSKRADRPFVEVNCAAIPKDLIESELFGHEKGSFTGAQAQRIGKFEQADTGTLFLDEIGDMHLEAQSKMLRVIEEHRLERVGSSTGRPIPINVRILAATNKNLSEEIRQGRFREDLFHRINVIPVYVPPLRERREDIPMLVKAFSEEFCQQMNRKQVTFDTDAMELLVRLPYTGNIRELRNVIERIVILTMGDVVNKDDVERLGLAFSMPHTTGGSAFGSERQGSIQQQSIPYTPPPSSSSATSERASSIELGSSAFGTEGTAFVSPDEDDDLSKSVILTPKDRERLDAIERGDVGHSTGYSLLSDQHDPMRNAMQAETFQEFKDRAEKAYIEERLREHNWNISRTAEALDIQRSHLYTKMRKYGLMKDKHHDEPTEDLRAQE